ncbi:hypothetical protein Tco_0508676 [Tanacetum coccineum]
MGCSFLQKDSAALQTRLLQHVGLAVYGSTFDDALCVFNTSMEIEFLGVPLFAISKSCSACSKVFTGDVYGTYACVMVLWRYRIKHRHNAVRDTLVDICFRSKISAGKEDDMGLVEGSSPLTQTGMANFVQYGVGDCVAQRNWYGPWIDTNRVLPLGPRKCKVVFGYFLNDSLKDDEDFVAKSLKASERVQMEDIMLFDNIASYTIGLKVHDGHVRWVE